jgi:hypothetical protein
MRRAFATLLAVTVMVGLAVPAASAAPSPANLSKQIKALQKQVTALKKQVKKMNTALGQTEGVAVVALLYGGCNTAVTADALQGGNPTAYGSTPVSDYNVCSQLQQIVGVTPTIVRQPNVPTVNVFQELLNVFKP